MTRLIGVLITLSLFPASSFAQERAAEPEEVEQEAPEPVETAEAESPAESSGDVEARTRFELGQQLYEQGRFEDALEQFQAAHTLSGRPGFLYNIYLCHRDAGNNREAASALRQYLDAESEVTSRAMLERRLASLDEQVAREEEADRRAVEAEQRAAAAVVDRDFTGPLVTLIAGVVVLGAAGSLGLANRGLHDDLTSRCYDGELCLSEDRGEIDSLDRRNLTADVLAGVGGAVTIAGLVWLIVEATTGGGEDEVDVACGVGGCSVRGRF